MPAARRRRPQQDFFITHETLPYVVRVRAVITATDAALNDAFSFRRRQMHASFERAQ